jgi:hypothetical protein
MTNLFDPPRIFSLPLSLGKDLVVDFQRQVSGVPADYDSGTVVTLIIDTVVPIVGLATITGHHAVVSIPSEVTDAIKAGLLWRCLVTLPDATDLVPANGTTARYDGRVQRA